MSTKQKESTKLRGLIRIGVFSALWIAVGWIIGCTVGFFPPIMLALPCILSVFGALILVVMLSKNNNPRRNFDFFVPVRYLPVFYGSLRPYVYLHFHWRNYW